MPNPPFVNPANALTLARTLLIAPTVWCILKGFWWVAALLFTLAVISDVYDGKLARKYNQVSPVGGLLDHGTDALFVTVGVIALAYLNLVPFLLGILIPTAFIQYMLDSKALAGKSLRTSVLGKSNGVAYFALLGTGIGAHTLLELNEVSGLTVVPLWGFIISPGLEIAAWVLIATTAISMLDRLMMLLKGQL